jgi:hypothetical protein
MYCAISAVNDGGCFLCYIAGKAEMTMDDIPDTWLECAQMMEGILLAACEGKKDNDRAYQRLRQQFMQDSVLKPLLPDFVRTRRDLGAFWPFIKEKFPSYAQRRQFVRDAFLPLYEHLEGTEKIPVDEVADDVLAKFDPEGVHAVWRKAVARRHSDPEGAITSARTLLETVCKKILDKQGVPYDEKDDLPALYRKVALTLDIAPSQYTEETFKRILGGCTNVVEGLGTLRNKAGDAHGQGGNPVRPDARHAQLAVNLAGAMATYIVETWRDTKASHKSVIVDGASGLKVEATGRTRAEADGNAAAKLQEERAKFFK